MIGGEYAPLIVKETTFERFYPTCLLGHPELFETTPNLPRGDTFTLNAKITIQCSTTDNHRNNTSD
jgi:hypothetical protein